MQEVYAAGLFIGFVRAFAQVFCPKTGFVRATGALLPQRIFSFPLSNRTSAVRRIFPRRRGIVHEAVSERGDFLGDGGILFGDFRFGGVHEDFDFVSETVDEVSPAALHAGCQRALVRPPVG